MNAILGSLMLLMVISADSETNQKMKFDFPSGSIVVNVKTLKGVLPDSALTIMGLTLDKSTFEDVRSVLGQTPDLPRTDDPHEADSICYSAASVSGTGNSSIHLSFTAGWPENPTEFLTSFTLSAGKLATLKGKCSSSQTLSKKTKTANGIGLGMTQAELIKTLGQPSAVSSALVVYSFAEYHEYSANERENRRIATGGYVFKGEYIYHNLVGHFTHGKLDSLEVSVGGEPDW